MKTKKETKPCSKNYRFDKTSNKTSQCIVPNNSSHNYESINSILLEEKLNHEVEMVLGQRKSTIYKRFCPLSVCMYCAG